MPGLETHSLARLMAELFPSEAHGWREESDREATLSISATPETAAPPPAAPGLGSLPDPICDFRGEKPPATPFPPPARPRWRMRLALPASLSLAVACAAYALSTRDAGRAVANPMPRVERAAPASPTPETFEPTPETAAPLAVAAAPVTVDETSPADDLPAPRPQDGTATAPPDAEIEEQPAQSDDAIDDDIDIDLADLRKVSP